MWFDCFVSKGGDQLFPVSVDDKHVRLFVVHARSEDRRKKNQNDPSIDECHPTFQNVARIGKKIAVKIYRFE